MKNKFQFAMTLAVIFAMAFTSLALADNLVADGDGLMPINEVATLNIGNVCRGGSTSASLYLLIKRVGSGQVYDNSANIAVSGSPASASLSTAFADSSILLPSNWPSVSNNTFSSDTAQASVAAGAGVAESLGPKTGSVTYTATGPEDGGGTLSRSLTITVNWTVVNCDTTPPVITPNVTGTLGNNGWYTSDVTVSWSVVDNESAVSSSSGCDSTTINTDTSGMTFTCTATSAGGTSSQSVTIKRDATAPTISASVSPAPAITGWYNTSTGAPTVSFTCDDTGGSGLASCTSASTLGNGADQSVTGTASDGAGNTASATASNIDVDLNAPTISASISPASPAASGWYNASTGAPTVSFTCDDTGGSSLASTCPSPVILSDGENQSVSGGSVSDVAGNVSSEAILTDIDVDLTAPSVTVTPDGPPDFNSWYNAAVLFDTAGSDATSGVSDANCTADQNYVGPDGTNLTVNGSCTDNAGNVGNGTSAAFNFDDTAPSITITTPPNGASYLLNQPVPSNYGCTDSLSGIATCAGPVASGSNIDTSSTGGQSFVVNASDSAGNTNSATNSYSVAFKLCVLYDQTKAHKSGSTVPVKLQLCDFNGVNYSSAAIVVRAISVSKIDNSASGILDDSGAANSPDMNFRYDATLGGTGGYIFNLSTKGLTTGTWKVTFTVNGGGSYFVQFDVK